MKYHVFAFSALASGAFAQSTRSQIKNATQSAEGLASVISVLETALPSTLLQEALTNSAAVSAKIASDFAAGQTPSWFIALPSDVQTYLVPSSAVANGTNTGSLIPSVTPINSVNGTATRGSARSSTAKRTTVTETDSQTSGTSSVETGAVESTQSGSSSSSVGLAAIPTAIAGMGLVGAAGIVGVLAL